MKGQEGAQTAMPLGSHSPCGIMPGIKLTEPHPRVPRNTFSVNLPGSPRGARDQTKVSHTQGKHLKPLRHCITSLQPIEETLLPFSLQVTPTSAQSLLLGSVLRNQFQRKLFKNSHTVHGYQRFSLLSSNQRFSLLSSNQ